MAFWDYLVCIRRVNFCLLLLFYHLIKKFMCNNRKFFRLFCFHGSCFFFFVFFFCCVETMCVVKLLCCWDIGDLVGDVRECCNAILMTEVSWKALYRMLNQFNRIFSFVKCCVNSTWHEINLRKKLWSLLYQYLHPQHNGIFILWIDYCIIIDCPKW